MRCNHSKADRLVEELGWTMRCVPAVPRGAHWRLIARRTTVIRSGGLPGGVERRLTGCPGR